MIDLLVEQIDGQYASARMKSDVYMLCIEKRIMLRACVHAVGHVGHRRPTSSTNKMPGTASLSFSLFTRRQRDPTQRLRGSINNGHQQAFVFVDLASGWRLTAGIYRSMMYVKYRTRFIPFCANRQSVCGECAVSVCFVSVFTNRCCGSSTRLGLTFIRTDSRYETL